MDLVDIGIFIIIVFFFLLGERFIVSENIKKKKIPQRISLESTRTVSQRIMATYRELRLAQ